jgi:hypothetical protein
VLVSTWALTAILGDLFSKRRAIDALVQVTQLGCLGLPNFAVTGRLTTECMGNFVQQHLLDHLKISGFNQVPRDCDALLRVVAKPRSADSSIEAKGVVHQPVTLK